MEQGMCMPMSNAAFARLMCTNSKGQIIPASVAIFVKRWPELAEFVPTK